MQYKSINASQSESCLFSHSFWHSVILIIATFNLYWSSDNYDKMHEKYSSIVKIMVSMKSQSIGKVRNEAKQLSLPGGTWSIGEMVLSLVVNAKWLGFFASRNLLQSNIWSLHELSWTVTIQSERRKWTKMNFHETSIIHKIEILPWMMHWLRKENTWTEIFYNNKHKTITTQLSDIYNEKLGLDEFISLDKWKKYLFFFEMRFSTKKFKKLSLENL